MARDNQLLPLRTLRAGRDFLTGMRSTVSKVTQATELSLDALSAFNLVSGRCGYWGTAEMVDGCEWWRSLD